MSKKLRSPLTEYAGLAFSFGLTLVLAMLIGFYAGQYVDNRLGTSPWFMLLGLFLGVGAAFRSLVRDLMRKLKEESREGGGDRS